MDMEHCAAVPSSTFTYGPYDVFINHRGPDVKKTLASLLYHRLIKDGLLRVFLDRDELQQGDEVNAQIKNAIRTTSVHIAILSKNYAKSYWCLNELCLMLESRAPIIPVFYDVKPSHLRWMDKKGPYAKAFKIHTRNNRFDTATIQKWKTALHQVSYLSGYELEAYNGDLGVLLEKIVQGVSKKIQKLPIHVAENPVGLEDAVQDFEQKMLREDGRSGNVKVVGIVGLGGVGKTTLATELFNRKRSNYGGASYLDITEAAINVLQSRLLNDLSHVDSRIDFIKEGKEILVSRLSSWHALIVLDNVDRKEQLDAFLPLRDVLRSGSLILVTSRYKDLLSSSGISLIYKLRGLNKKHSEELFCWHAFQQATPPPEFQYLVEQYLIACCGLPLSLKVIGALLYGNDQSFWTCQLDKLTKILPTEITERLKISFDALDRYQKQIFLDISCFFVGEYKDTAVRIWDGSEWNGMQGLQTLQNKCLVEVDDKTVIKMHDSLRDLGRNITDEERSENPRRLWRSMDINHLPKQLLSERMEVRGIKFIQNPEPSRTACHRLCISPLMQQGSYPAIDKGFFDALNSLKLLTAQGDGLEDIFNKASPNLIWLRWLDCPYAWIPSWISLQNLRVLELNSQRNMTTLWGRRSQVPLQLRELNIHSILSKFPESIGKLRHLQKLVLNKKADYKGQAVIGSSIKVLPESFCNLHSLKHLQLIRCKNLKHLPKQFGNLTSLQYINLSYCNNLQELPKSFGNLVNLKHLCLKECTELNITGDILEKISMLEFLNLKRCKKVEVLPIDVANQQLLKALNLRGTRLKELPDRIGELRFLKVLKLGSLFFKRLPPAVGRLESLERLEISESHSLVMSKSLERPKLCKSQSLRRFKSIATPKIPQIISESESKSLQGVGEISEFDSLPAVGEISESQSLPKVGEMRSVGSNIDTSEAMHSGVPVELGSSFSAPMILLKHISLHGTKISMIFISKDICPNLERLDLSSCHNLAEVTELPKTLVKLDLSDCRALELLSGLSECVHLRELDIGGCEQVKKLPSFELVTSLEKLRARHCKKLRILEGLEKLPNLRELDVSLCRKLLQLAVDECSGSVENDLGLAGDKRLTSLEKLYAGDCWRMQSIRGLQQLKRLKDIQICPHNFSIWDEVQRIGCELRSLTLSAKLRERKGGREIDRIINSLASSLRVFKAKRGSSWKVGSMQGFKANRESPWKVKLPMCSGSLVLCIVNDNSAVHVGLLHAATATRSFDGDIVFKCRNGSVEVYEIVSDSLLLEIPLTKPCSEISLVDAWMVSTGRDKEKGREFWNKLCSRLFGY